MKCQYKFPASGSVRFPVGIRFDADSRTYEIEVSDERISNITVIVSNFPPDSLPSFRPLQNQFAKAEIVIPEDPIRASVVADIRAIEGGLCLWGLDEIDTESVSIEWIPESDEEKKRLELFSFSISKDSQEARQPPDAQLQLFARTVAGVSGFSDSEVPLNFFRRGKKDLREGRFIDAIYDFYFVLETLFANGKFHKSAVIKEFISSPELLDAITYLKTEIDDPIHFPFDLRAAYQETLRDRTREEVIKHLVEVRGFLHHHTLKRKDIWHPANQKQFRVDCILLVNICQHILSGRVSRHLFDEQVYRDFLNTEVLTSDGQTINWIYNDGP